MIKRTTAEIKIPKRIAEQVVGQDNAIELIKKAAKQHRHILLIGEPGIGKSMVSQALAELMPSEKLVDVLVHPNPADENTPLIKTVPKGQGKQIVTRAKLQALSSFKNQNIIMFIVIIIISLIPYYFWKTKQISDVVYAASMISSMVFIVGFILFINLGKRMKVGESQNVIPKLLIDNSEKKEAPFIDATGTHAGALLGDCLHDPLQSFHNLTVIKTQGGRSGVCINNIKIEKYVNDILKRSKSLIKKNNYTAVFLSDNSKILGIKNDKISDIKVLSVNRYEYRYKYLIRLVTDSGKDLIVTPEHKIAIKSLFNKIKYIRADKIKPWHKLITMS